MQVLEKILEEIENEAMTNKEIGRKQCEGMARAMTIIRSHIDNSKGADITIKCSECSRRKWYQIGYEDGRKSNEYMYSTDLHKDEIQPVSGEFLQDCRETAEKYRVCLSDEEIKVVIDALSGTPTCAKAEFTDKIEKILRASRNI